MLRIGLIGNGTIAATHIAAIKESKLAQLVCICDSDQNKKMEGLPFYTDIDTMIDTESLDCIHICLPHYLHVPIVEKCAKRNMNVFVEKPLGLTYKEASSLFELEEIYNVKIGVSFQNRYNPTTVKLKNIIDSKLYGKILGSKGIVTWSRSDAYYKEASWRGNLALAGSGVMLNQSIHTLDLLSYLGGTFNSVDGRIANFSVKDWGIEDSVMAKMEYSDHKAPSVFFATNSYSCNASIELEFVLEKAIFRIKDCSLYKFDLISNDSELLCSDIVPEGAKNYYGANHTLAIEHFYQAILGTGDNYISVKEGAYTLKVIDAIVVSNNTNETVKID